MDLEFFNNNTENSTFDPDDSYTFDINYFIAIPTSLVAVLSSVANVLIIFMIIRFSVLHTQSYFYLGNWCTCNFVITASAHATLNVLGIAEIISDTVLCIWTEVTFVFIFGNIIFIALLVLDWYIITFKGQGYCAIKCRRSYKFIGIVVWILLLILLVMSVLYCLEFASLPLLALIVCLTYLFVNVLIFVIIILRIVKLKTSSVVVEKSNIEFKIAISHFACWIPNLLFLIIHFLLHNYLVLLLEFIAYFMWYSNACVIFLLLYFNDENFRTCLNELFNINLKTVKKDNKDIPLISV